MDTHTQRGNYSENVRERSLLWIMMALYVGKKGNELVIQHPVFEICPYRGTIVYYV